MPPRSPSKAPPASPTTPLPLPAFLKLLTSSPKPPVLSMAQAITAAKSLYPKHNTFQSIQHLTQEHMLKLGITDEVIRKGLAQLGQGKGKPARKRKGDDLDRPLPVSKVVNEVQEGDLDFEEIHYEEVSCMQPCGAHPLRTLASMQNYKH